MKLGGYIEQYYCHHSILWSSVCCSDLWMVPFRPLQVWLCLWLNNCPHLSVYQKNDELQLFQCCIFSLRMLLNCNLLTTKFCWQLLVSSDQSSSLVRLSWLFKCGQGEIQMRAKHLQYLPHVCTAIPRLPPTCSAIVLSSKALVLSSTAGIYNVACILVMSSLSLASAL